MAKKIKFPLEMENKNVTSIDELRNNFSIFLVLEYARDGRLIKWLRDRSEHDIADAISQVDLDSTDAARQICEIFCVPYCEDDIENAKERERKLALLKMHPECEEYESKVDMIAFEQDDLYNLLDKDVYEIYLCGDRFSVPIDKENKKYIGITDNVVIVIESEKVIDFEEKSIYFVNCRFDDQYENLLISLEEKDVSLESKKGIITSAALDQDELKAFVADLLECITEFADKEYENEDDELYEYDNCIECSADDYNDNYFSTKAKAKVACKESISKMIKDTTSLFLDAKDELIDATDVYYDGLKQQVIDFLPKFYESYEELIYVHCSGETQLFLKEKLNEQKKELPVKKWSADVQDAFKEAFDITVKDRFDIYKESISEKKLFSLCEYEEEDNDYSFSVEKAAEALVDTYEDIITTEELYLPKYVLGKYKKLKAEFLSMIEQWVDYIFPSYGAQKTVTKTQKTVESTQSRNFFELLSDLSKYKK
ncbi:hypothetical protein [Butyrivibrio fibrisolvens]|uniref:hypothetical protein n=1 Tax=Butyrivibrio fibrisolvens TaxID=831 RepID=UPI000480932A|nr:hypothetical protein [Butyrivibrio fibrisolvens]